MDKCCTSEPTHRLQRRTNGLQLPLNYQQVIGWIVFLVTALINLVILIEIQFQELKMISLITYIILYVFHIGSHATALMTDPSEKEIRNLKVDNVPEFDRSVHAHVIENGRCHLCNIYTSSRNTKHCSLCNKCVDRFDHHCKWLNNCIGQRNYAAFITCVTTALLISLFTTSLCITDIVLFLAQPEHLSSTAQYFVNCSTVDTTVFSKYCKDSITFLTFLIIFAISAFAIACALLHLCCFHVYISILGVSTYEYIVKNGTSNTSQPRCSSNNRNCCAVNVTKRIYIIRNNPDKNTSRQSDGRIENESDDKANTSNIQTGQSHLQRNNETNVADLISVLISNELGRAKKMFLYDNNKIHPQNQNTSS